MRWIKKLNKTGIALKLFQMGSGIALKLHWNCSDFTWKCLLFRIWSSEFDRGQNVLKLHHNCTRTEPKLPWYHLKTSGTWRFSCSETALKMHWSHLKMLQNCSEFNQISGANCLEKMLDYSTRTAPKQPWYHLKTSGTWWWSCSEAAPKMHWSHLKMLQNRSEFDQISGANCLGKNSRQLHRSCTEVALIPPENIWNMALKLF